jgi:4-hydroxybenzoyl-CoA thioesterase
VRGILARPGGQPAEENDMEKPAEREVATPGTAANLGTPANSGAKTGDPALGTLVNRRNVRIEWGHCDAAGIVFFPRYFEYFDASTHALFEHAGCPQREMREKFQIVGCPLVEARARFLAPLHYDEDVIIETCIAEFSRRSFRVQHRLYKGETLAVEGWETRVWTALSADDPKKMESRPIPEEFIRKFSGA